MGERPQRNGPGSIDPLLLSGSKVPFPGLMPMSPGGRGSRPVKVARPVPVHPPLAVPVLGDHIHTR